MVVYLMYDLNAVRTDNKTVKGSMLQICAWQQRQQMVTPINIFLSKCLIALSLRNCIEIPVIRIRPQYITVLTVLATFLWWLL